MDTAVLTSARRKEVGPCSVTEGRTALERDQKAHKSPLGPGVREDDSERQEQERAAVPRAPPTAPGPVLSLAHRPAGTDCSPRPTHMVRT